MAIVRFKVITDSEEIRKRVFPTLAFDQEGNLSVRKDAEPQEIEVIPAILAGRLKGTVEEVVEVLWLLTNNDDAGQMVCTLRPTVRRLRNEVRVIATQVLAILCPEDHEEESGFFNNWLEMHGDVIEDALKDRAGSL